MAARKSPNPKPDIKLIGRPRVIESPEAMEALWEEYKLYCSDQKVLTHEFSSKNSEFVSKNLRRNITATIEGFCVWLKMARSAFYNTYANDERFKDIVTRITEECEIDARMKFELGIIPSQLAGLWMSKHGYTIKNENDLKSNQPVVFVGVDSVAD